MNKKILHNIHGIFLLDKPLNMTSNQALQSVKRLFSAKKAGHTGSLDPLATGMLPICFGEATKFSQFLLESDKCYEVTVKFGEKTTTGDAEGEIISKKPVDGVSQEKIEELLPKFRGQIQQIPPMYSAIKYKGKPLYELARKGIEVERVARPVTIYEFSLQHVAGEHAKFIVRCSKGTYIRTLMEDLGEELGCGAHVSVLHRSYVFPYQAAKMHNLSDITDIFQQGGIDALHSYLLPVETAVQSLPPLTLSQSAIFYIRVGQPVMVPSQSIQGEVRLFTESGRFIGVGAMQSDGRIAPRKLMASV